MTESVKNELSDICRIIDATVDITSTGEARVSAVIEVQ